MATGPILDSGALTLALTVAGVGVTCMWRVLAGVLESHTTVHDTKVKVAELQIKYLARTRGIQVGSPGDDDQSDVIEVGSPGETAAPQAKAAA
ncbi:MAG: hypothetical protein R3B68_03835 [Phycisphaerales bacterium]